MNLSEATIEMVCTQVTTTSPVFNSLNPDEDDKKRKSGKLSKKQQVDIFEQLKALCVSILGNEITLEKTLSVLRSDPGCNEQPPHTDYDEEMFEVDSEHIPCSAIVCIEENTRFVCWPGSHQWIRDRGAVLSVSAFSSERREIVLSKGDTVIFRGDLIHAGAAYAFSNTRIFTYIDVPGVERYVDVDTYHVIVVDEK